jgi:hypothetical protein
MRTINSLEDNSSDILDEVIKKKNRWTRKTILESLMSQVKESYIKYIENRKNLFVMVPQWHWNDSKDCLIHCYDSPTTRTIELQRNIRKLSTYCPYCNLSTTNSIDHYLPKEEFPEFSIMRENLIPSCSECNGIKGLKWKNSTNRIILNVYFDEIPKEQFIFIKLDIIEGIIQWNFYLNLPVWIEGGLREVIKCHVKELNLMYRYEDPFKGVISEICWWARNGKNKLNIKELKWIIEYTYNGFISERWNNYWKAVVYKEIMESKNILNYIVNKT